VNYLIWRLHRNQVYIAGAALAVVLLITGISMTHDYHALLASCGAAHSCGDASQVFSGDSVIIGLVYATMAIPLLFGLFWGAPLLAREFEDGTHNLAWTLGVTRRRWLSRNVMWALLAAALCGAVMAALVIFTAVRIAIVYVRPHYMTPITRLVSFVQGTSASADRLLDPQERNHRTERPELRLHQFP
jgi:ABC-type transport system involved in multi-copper enzyme maturation permease subunit